MTITMLLVNTLRGRRACPRPDACAPMPHATPCCRREPAGLRRHPARARGAGARRAAGRGRSALERAVGPDGAGRLRRAVALCSTWPIERLRPRLGRGDPPAARWPTRRRCARPTTTNLPRITDFHTRLGADARLYAKYKAVAASPAAARWPGTAQGAGRRAARLRARRRRTAGRGARAPSPRSRNAPPSCSSVTASNVLDATDALRACTPSSRTGRRARTTCARPRATPPRPTGQARLPADAARPRATAR